MRPETFPVVGKPVVAPRPGILRVLLFGTCFLVFGCAGARQPLTEAPPAAQATTQLTHRAPLSNFLPPKPKEIESAVSRVFKDAALVDDSSEPNFVAGDFNGDHSQDLAVVIKVEKLADINQEAPPWLLKDPFLPESVGMPTLRVEADERLLAVIHGHSDEGWRHADATQTFLLKNATSSRMELHAAKEFLSANSPRNLPRLQGDLIGAVLRGKWGYLFYAGATYSWYDPKAVAGQR